MIANLFRRMFLTLVSATLTGCMKREELFSYVEENTEVTKPNHGRKRVDGKVHAYLDLEYWRSEARMSKSVLGNDNNAWILHPLEFVHYDQLRERDIAPHCVNERRVEVDVVFWCDENPELPYLTKLGGVPFRSGELPWPTKKGKPLTFLAQYNFQDSLDLFPDLPGDLLLVFASKIEEIYEGGPNAEETGLYVEWVKIANVTNPVRQEECKSQFYVPRYSAVLHRYFDYKFESTYTKRLAQKFRTVPAWNELTSIRMTKIGMSYLEVQPGWDPREWIKGDESLANVFQISVLFPIDCRFKKGDFFLNDPRTGELELLSREKNLVSLQFCGDPGHLIFFSNDNGDLAFGYFIGG